MAAKKKQVDQHRHPMVPFRADDETRDALDAIRAHYAQTTGFPVTRSDVLRRLIMDAEKNLGKTSKHG